MNIFKQVSIIFFLCILGDFVSNMLPFPFPGSVIAMVFLFLFLILKVIKPHHIEDVANYLMSILAALFVTTTVSIVQYYDILKSVLFRFILICIIASVVTFLVTAYTVTFVIYLKKRKR